MEQKPKNLNYIRPLVILISLIFIFYIGNNIVSIKNSQKTPEIVPSSVIRTPKGDIKVLIASTTEAQIQGLSGRASLGDDEGMLFVFSTSSIQSFWMKDMHFSIDIIWIDENFNVIDVESEVSPDTYPNIFSSPLPARYVLEINAGFAQKFDIKKGTSLNLVD